LKGKGSEREGTASAVPIKPNKNRGFSPKIEDARMTNQIIDRLLAKSRRTDIPNFGPGDTVKVQVKIKEGDKERIQAFEGVVISRTRGPQASFTVRKISFGQGVERIFPIQSKVVDKVDVLRSAKVRRAKLYYLRELRGKAARLKEVDTRA
jgi:large subunit ribosomal protein L19